MFLILNVREAIRKQTRLWAVLKLSFVTHQIFMCVFRLKKATEKAAIRISL